MAEQKSRLYALKPLIDRWPAITKPEGHVQFKTKIFWSTLCLVIYFALTNVMLYGVSQDQIDLFANFRAIMAGAAGTVMHLGIMPIVTASIILQLFTGAKIINLDLTKSEDKAVFQGTQKILVILMILVEAVPQVFGYLTPDERLVRQLGGGGNAQTLAQWTIISQIFMGALIAFLMDELISKWGIGSGISLFIVGGVAQSLLMGTLNWAPVTGGQPLDPFNNPPAGTLPMAWYVFSEATLSDIVNRGGFENMFIGNNAFPNPFIAFVGTVVVFMFVIFAEKTRVELPLAHGRVRGARGRYPIRLIYASVIPVILVSALLANINLFTILLWTHPSLSASSISIPFTDWSLPWLGSKWWVGMYPRDGSQSLQPIMGGAWYFGTFFGFQSWFMPLIDPVTYGGLMNGHTRWQLLIRILIHMVIYIGGSVMFAKFWIETTNMGPEAVARQIQSSGMQIPGFRRDPRVLRRILERYIPTITVIGGAIVGALALFGDMIGTIGQTGGTGVLLAAGIAIRTYEQIAKEQAMEMHPVLRQFFGVD